MLVAPQSSQGWPEALHYQPGLIWEQTREEKGPRAVCSTYRPRQVLAVKCLQALPHRAGKSLPSAAGPRGSQKLGDAWILQRSHLEHTGEGPYHTQLVAAARVEASFLCRVHTCGHCLHLGDDRTSPASISGTTHATKPTESRGP